MAVRLRSNRVKNILYITYVDYCQGAFPGVEDKIAGQMLAMREAGCHVDRVNQYARGAQLVDGETGAAELFEAGRFRRFSICKAVQAALRRRKYAAAYIRFQFFSEDVRRITALLHKSGARVVMEFPTYPYEGELHRQGWRGEIKLLCDRIFRRACTRNIDGFVTQAEEKAIYGVPCVHVLNGLDYSTHPLRSIRAPRPGEMHLAAVASMLPWHGYDRLLRGMADYYINKKSSDFNIVLHLVGDGRELALYRQIVAEGGLQDHVVFHGMQGGDALDAVMSGCDIAVGSLAAHRIGLKKLSTLKSREYCAWGFPSINASPTDILSPDDPFCLFVPEDESPVDMAAAVAFYKRVYFEGGLTAMEIAQRIRSAAEAQSDVRAVFRPVIDFIQWGSIQ